MKILYLERAADAENKTATPNKLAAVLCGTTHQAAVLACGDSEEIITEKDGTSFFQYVIETEESFRKAIGEGPLLARKYWLAVCRWIEDNGTPEIVDIFLEDCRGYYILQNKLLLHPILTGVKVVVHCESAGWLDADALEKGYQFPVYWENRLKRACLLSADVVICPSEEVKEHLLQLAEGLRSERVVAEPFAFSEQPDRERLLALYQKILAMDMQRESFPFSNTRAQTQPPLADGGEQGLLSVVIPFYNLGNTLGETLESMDAVDYPQCEVIIVNDGSTDIGSIEKLAQLRRERTDIRIIDIENGGLSNARNVGAQYAKGEFLTYLDADDKIKPCFYSRGVEILQHYGNVGYVYPWIEYFEGADGYWVTYNAELPYMLLGNMPSGGGTVVRRKLFLAFGQNRPVMKGGLEDYDGWLGLVEHGYFGVCLPEPMYLYRIRQNSMFRSIDTATRLNLYRLLEQGHSTLYKEYTKEVFNLMVANGSPINWMNPSALHSTMGYYTDEMLKEMKQAQEQIREIHQSNSLFWRVVREIWRRNAKR